LAGMLGRKVVISSATIPPDLAEGYFNTYKAGWSIFAKMRSKKIEVGCAWVDEFKTQIKTIECTQDRAAIAVYQKIHSDYVKNRVYSLSKEVVKRKAEIIPLSLSDTSDEKSTRKQFFQTIRQTIIKLHRHHETTDDQSRKRISFGVVRLANISPCIELTRYLLRTTWPEDIEIRTMAYHSQQVLIMRSEQEKHLDAVLKRKHGKQAAFDVPVIRAHLKKIKAQNVIFILVATPVEEIGRDHDFDWAVVEPSSYRSFIQLAGRILRHQTLQEDIANPNMAILQYNLKGALNQPIAFTRPGYENKELTLVTKNLKELIDEDEIGKCLDASPRINRNKDLNPEKNLADLEHETIHQLLTSYENQTPDSMQAWLTSYWWLTAMPQYLVKFRESSPTQRLFLVPTDVGLKFVKKDTYGNRTEPRELIYNIKHDENLSDIKPERLWIKRDYLQFLKGVCRTNLENTAMIYGELNVPLYNENDQFTYSSQLGLTRN